MRDDDLETEWQRSRCEIASLVVDLRLRHLIHCLLKAYHPGQPRDELGQ